MAVRGEVYLRILQEPRLQFLRGMCPFFYLFMTALTSENLLDHVFQVRFLSCKGLEGGFAAQFQFKIFYTLQ